MAEASEGSPVAGAPLRASSLDQTPAAPPTVPQSHFALTTERRRVVRISVALFVFTFLAYWLLGPMETAYDFQLSQANNIVHGHLDMDPAYTNNLTILERVLFDGEGFCLPLPDPRADQGNTYTVPVRQTADCLHYMQHSLGPAFLLAPLALFFGLTVNQALVSAFIGGLTAPLVFGITRRLGNHLPTQLALTALALFGTNLMFSAAAGSVWYFAHVTAVFFTFAAIYATVVMRNPLLAGAMVGAAFMCRPTMILAGIFPLVAFSDQWFVAAGGAARSAWQRVRERFRLRPLVALAAGVAPFIALTMLVNFLRFGKPFESGYSYTEQIFQSELAWVYPHGIFDPSYVTRHVAAVFERMPRFSGTGSYVWPSYWGLALWATSPALLLGLFAHLRRYQRTALAIAAGVAISAAFLLVSAALTDLGTAEVGPADVPFGLHVAPFWVLIGAAIVLSLVNRDRLVIACWAAILALVGINWVFAATGWAQFGYRYGLDFMPFLMLLVILAVPRIRWYHAALIGLSIVINLWGTLWIYKFDAMNLFGWTWVSY